MSKPGINFTTTDGTLTVGVHLSTFIHHFKKHTNRKGWVNFAIIPNDEPKGARGQYTHKLELIENKKDQNGPLEDINQ